jgi:TPR repeat
VKLHGKKHDAEEQEGWDVHPALDKEELQQTISATALTSGNEVLQKGNLRGAVERYQEAIGLDPKNALA